ncbi:MAG: hypothetical protein ACXVEF_01575 [Polyangiales bacterium]
MKVAYRAAMRLSSLVWFVFASACSSGGSGGGNATPLPEDDYCTRFVDEVCKIIVPCCAGISSPATDASCKSAYGAQCQSDRDKAKSNGLAYDAQAAGNCVSAISSYVVDCKSRPASDPVSVALNAACDGVYAGTVANGGACTTSTQCAHPANAMVSCVAGKCLIQPRPKIGEDCGSTTAFVTCEDGAFCDGTTKKCVALPAAGSPCAAVSQCAVGTYCDAAKVCQPKKPVGASCASSNECAGVCTAGTCALQTVVTDAECKAVASGKV